MERRAKGAQSRGAWEGPRARTSNRAHESRMHAHVSQPPRSRPLICPLLFYTRRSVALRGTASDSRPVVPRALSRSASRKIEYPRWEKDGRGERLDISEPPRTDRDTSVKRRDLLRKRRATTDCTWTRVGRQRCSGVLVQGRREVAPLRIVR